MNTRHDLDRSISAWLVAEAPDRAPERVLNESRERIQYTAQRRSIWPRPGWPTPRIGEIASYAKLAIAAAAVLVLIVVVGTSPPDLTRSGRATGAHASVLPSPATQPTPHPSTSSAAQFGQIDPGPYDIAWPLGPTDARIHLMVPAGWSWLGQERTLIYKDHGRLYGFPVDVATHGVSRVVTSVCALDESSSEVGPRYVEVGPTVDDLAAAISRVVGTRWSDPVDVTIGRYPAKRLVSTYSADCPGPARRWIWESEHGAFFVEEGVRSSIYIVDVNADRLVITTQERTGSPETVAELESIIASIDIERGQVTGILPTPLPTTSGRFPSAVGPDAELRAGRHEAIVEGIQFSFDVPTAGWEPQLGFYISKSSVGSQGAEGTIRWTTVPNGRNTAACPKVLDPSIDGSGADLAAAVAAAPGLDGVSGPTDVTIGGLAAKHVVATVRADLGCDPGYFYMYEPVNGGALWTDTIPGDTILVWIVDIDGRLLFIEAELHEADDARLRQEVEQMVASIEFV